MWHVDGRLLEIYFPTLFLEFFCELLAAFWELKFVKIMVILTSIFFRAPEFSIFHLQSWNFDEVLQTIASSRGISIVKILKSGPSKGPSWWYSSREAGFDDTVYPTIPRPVFPMFQDFSIFNTKRFNHVILFNFLMYHPYRIKLFQQVFQGPLMKKKLPLGTREEYVIVFFQMVFWNSCRYR